jgi:uncharacterized protein (DUF427 family)
MSAITQKLRRIVGAGDAGDDAGGGPVQAVWKGTVIARSDRTVKLEGNHYFPFDDVDFSHLETCSHRSVCPWKGTASYYDVVVDGERNRAAAWSYPRPSPAAAQIKGHVAFWHGVKVGRAARA